MVYPQFVSHVPAPRLCVCVCVALILVILDVWCNVAQPKQWRRHGSGGVGDLWVGWEKSGKGREKE